MRVAPALHAFAGYGIELEYMIVDRQTLAVMPMCDTLLQAAAACDGAMTPIDLDLSALQGKTVQFILAVRSDGSPQEDWAVWNSPLISR